MRSDFLSCKFNHFSLIRHHLPKFYFRPHIGVGDLPIRRRGKPQPNVLSRTEPPPERGDLRAPRGASRNLNPHLRYFSPIGLLHFLTGAREVPRLLVAPRTRQYHTARRPPRSGETSGRPAAKAATIVVRAAISPKDLSPPSLQSLLCKKGRQKATLPMLKFGMSYFTTFTALPACTFTKMPFSGFCTRTPWRL